MASAELDELVRSCQELPVPAILTTLETHKYVGVNDGAAALFGAPAADLIGDDVLCHIDARDREASRLAYAALAARVIDGYQVHRRIVTPDGTVVSLSVWGRRVEAGGQLYGMWVLGPASAPAIAVETLVAGASDVVLAVTDHDWLIEYMNADAHILGVTGSELRGFPLLGLVHPSAASEFLAAGAPSGSRPPWCHCVHSHAGRTRRLGRAPLLPGSRLRTRTATTGRRHKPRNAADRRWFFGGSARRAGSPCRSRGESKPGAQRPTSARTLAEGQRALSSPNRDRGSARCR